MNLKLDNLAAGIKLIEQAVGKFSQGPLSYYIEKMNCYTDALFNRFAPFKVGDKVRLTTTPEITETKSWGWMGAEHFLVKGAQGMVKDVDYHNNWFFANVEFDDETWKDKDGVCRLVDEKSIFVFAETFLEKI